MPNPSHTPNHNIRIPDDTWDAAAAKAERHGETVSSVVRESLQRYAAAPVLAPGDTVDLVKLRHGDDGLYVVEEGPIHGTLGETVVTLRKVEP